jgi:EAL domain-containing protein (putative c-di-GMP-specific phosphodiesterase class I)
MEILVRIADADGHILEPGAFIPAAERFGMMTVIDRRIISTAISHYRSFFDEPDQSVMALNLSGLSLTDPGMIDFIKAELQTAEIDPHCICFEITETAAIRNFAQAQHFVSEMRKLGCLFSLDDFGSGLSSFSYLREFKVDFLKIDSSFVRRMTDDPVNRTLVSAINDIGHAMGMKTIAEGAEDHAVIELLQRLGVDYVQGYAIAKPRPLYRHPRAPNITL